MTEFRLLSVVISRNVVEIFFLFRVCIKQNLGDPDRLMLQKPAARIHAYDVIKPLRRWTFHLVFLGHGEKFRGRLLHVG